MTESNRGFDPVFEEKILQAIFGDPVFGEQILEVLEPQFFDLDHTKQIASLLIDYYRQYEAFPSVSLIKSICETETKSPILKKKCLDYVAKIQKKPLNGDSQYVKDKSLMFFRTQAVRNALLDEVIPKIEKENLEEILPIIQNAINKGISRDVGLEYKQDNETRFLEHEDHKVPTPWGYLNKILQGGWEGGRLITFIGGTGCHSRGTKILTYEGEFKNVENIQPNDLLMGPDSLPREVKTLFHGINTMYKIQPTKGKHFKVNENHILSLCKTGNYHDYINISVKDYINKSKKFKHQYKLYRPEKIQFKQNKNELKISPYVLGIMLGDGCLSKQRLEITTADVEIKNEILQEAQKWNLGISEHFKKDNKAVGYYFTNNYKHNNPIIQELKNLELIDKKSENKFIPKKYKISSYQDRLELLAGLIDSDGHNTNNCFEYVTKSNQLAHDVKFVCQSLGLAAYISQKIINDVVYYRLSISGDCSIIPSRLSRKQCSSRKQIKNHLVTGFTVEKLQDDDYFGFEVDSDNRYVMEDFFVTHNSGKSHALVDVGAGALLAPKEDGSGRTVVHYTLELSEVDVARRYDAFFTGVDINHVPQNKAKILNILKNKLPKDSHLIIKEYPMWSASISNIKAHLSRLRLKDIIPDIVVIDYGDLLAPMDRNKKDDRPTSGIWGNMKALAQEMKIPVVTATQSNREGFNQEVLTPDKVADDFKKIMHSDVIITLARNMEQKVTGFGKGYMAKNRQGEDGMIFGYKIETKKSTIEMFELTEEVEEEIEKALRQVRRKEAKSDLDAARNILRKNKDEDE